LYLATINSDGGLFKQSRKENFMTDEVMKNLTADVLAKMNEADGLSSAEKALKLAESSHRERLALIDKALGKDDESKVMRAVGAVIKQM